METKLQPSATQSDTIVAILGRMTDMVVKATPDSVVAARRSPCHEETQFREDFLTLAVPLARFSAQDTDLEGV